MEVKQLTPPLLEKARAKFANECGVRIEDVGGIVIDEVSFVAAGVFGQVDYMLRQLTGNMDVECGGIPLLLCGDNHQKPPPGDATWYTELVGSLPAVSRSAKGNKSPAVGSVHPVALGLKLLKAARRVELKRLMRAVDDANFVKVQEEMRDTTAERPISSAFLDAMRPVSAKDLEQDDGWRFAPIGVVSRMERDVINLARAEDFARVFGLPFIKWKLPIIDGGVPTDEGLRGDLYKDEIGLWGYFVEGALLCPCSA